MTSELALTAFLANRSCTNRDELVTAHLYLCLRAAKKFFRTGVDRADLMQVAAVGLIKAVDHYDAGLRTPFEAYAWLLVVGELMHYVRDHERIVRVPRRLRALEKQYVHANETLRARLGRHPGAVELATELGVSPAVVDEIRQLRRGGTISLQAWTGSPTGELPAGSGDIGVTDRLALVSAIEDLAERERLAVLGSFGADLSQAEIGARLGLSQSQVSKLLKRALSKLHARVA